jgi:hypothetical protein
MRPATTPPWLIELLVALTRATPSAGDVHRPDVLPAYCVLAPWNLGNFIQTVSERAVLASSGGAHETPAYEDTLRFARGIEDERRAVELLEARGCRYAITERTAAARPSGLRSFAAGLHDHDGSDGESRAGTGRFRLLLESHDVPPPQVPRYKVFALVEGALLVFPGRGAAAVRARVPLPPRTVTYTRALERGNDGRLAVRVSQPGRYDVLDANSAVLGSIVVSEEAVDQGQTLSLIAAP